MNLTRTLRVIHRDLGFLVVGISLVYGISGILLNHMNGKDPAFHTDTKTVQLPANLDENELTTTWQTNKDLPPLKRIMRSDDSHLQVFLNGGTGIYNTVDGSFSYERYIKRPLIYWINRLHYNKVKGWVWVADCFAGSLIFLAISGLFIVKGKRGLAGSGKWYLIAGILIPILFGLLFLH